MQQNFAISIVDDSLEFSYREVNVEMWILEALSVFRDRWRSIKFKALIWWSVMSFVKLISETFEREVAIDCDADKLEQENPTNGNDLDYIEKVKCESEELKGDWKCFIIKSKSIGDEWTVRVRSEEHTYEDEGG